MVEIKYDTLYVNGTPIKRYKPFSAPFILAKWFLERKKFYKREAEQFCDIEDIPYTSLEVEISSINRLTKENFGKPLFLKNKKYNPLYYLNPEFDDDGELMVVYVPKSMVKELEKYRVKDLTNEE